MVEEKVCSWLYTGLQVESDRSESTTHRSTEVDLLHKAKGDWWSAPWYLAEHRSVLPHNIHNLTSVTQVIHIRSFRDQCKHSYYHVRSYYGYSGYSVCICNISFHFHCRLVFYYCLFIILVRDLVSFKSLLCTLTVVAVNLFCVLEEAS